MRNAAKYSCAPQALLRSKKKKMEEKNDPPCSIAMDNEHLPIKTDPTHLSKPARKHPALGHEIPSLERRRRIARRRRRLADIERDNPRRRMRPRRLHNQRRRLRGRRPHRRGLRPAADDLSVYRENIDVPQNFLRRPRRRGPCVRSRRGTSWRRLAAVHGCRCRLASRRVRSRR
jgi:hypothetical protein